MDITLIGGGWDVPGQVACLTPFLEAATERAGGRPRIAFVWVDEGDAEYGARWPALLQKAGDADPVDVAVPIGTTLDPQRLDGVHGIFVCGGLTPAYAEALAPAAERIRSLVLGDGVPYVGSSAGAAVAARHAVVGGYLDGGRVVCPEDSAEDLEEVTVVAGLGLVEPMVDVHASAWGTIPRLAAALRKAPPGTTGIALDENTALRLAGRDTDGVLGANAVHELELHDRDTTTWVTRPAS